MFHGKLPLIPTYYVTFTTVTEVLVYKLLAHSRWFSPDTPASSSTKTVRHDIAEILLKVALNTKNQSIRSFVFFHCIIIYPMFDKTSKSATIAHQEKNNNIVTITIIVCLFIFVIYFEEKHIHINQKILQTLIISRMSYFHTN